MRHCTSHDLLCDAALGYCVVCRDHTDCPDVYHCALGQCEPDVCESGQTACESGSLVTCSEAGDAFDNPQACAQSVCVEHGATAACDVPEGGLPEAGVADGSCTTVFYRDSDDDTFGDANDTVTACSAPDGYVDNSDDCYDDNASAKPGQADYFADDRGDGSFDYDCVEGETWEFTTSGSCGGFPTCNLAAGWDGAPPDCGASGDWLTACSGLVDVCQKTTEPKTQECH